MHTIRARNVNDAYLQGLFLLNDAAGRRPSRNGNVLVMDESVSTMYSRPHERVLFNAQRDANPFFHLVESLWMLAGRADIELLTYYVPHMRTFSDDGLFFNAAYGHRWRCHFLRHHEGPYHRTIDQLDLVVEMLRENPHDRRAYVAMWDPRDLGSTSKDVACNVGVKFELSADGEYLNMTVFNRSNDIVWGLYGANAVHFSVLQEYMAARLGKEIGWYEHVSANFHAYEERWDKVWPVQQTDRDRYDAHPNDPLHVSTFPLVFDPVSWDRENHTCIKLLTAEKTLRLPDVEAMVNPFFREILYPMTFAYFGHRTVKNTSGAIRALENAIDVAGRVDWLVAGREWLLRRVI
jgi:thymidylate synthase